MILVKFWKWLKLLNSVPFIKKTLVNHLSFWIWLFWLTFSALQWMKKNLIVKLKISAKVQVSLLIKIRKWLRLLNSFPFIKTTLVNHVDIRIWSSWLTLTVFQWIKTNFKIKQFSRFLLKSEYAIQVKIRKWLKLLNSVPFIKKTLVNHVYIRICSFWLTLTVLQWMKRYFKISQFSRFLVRSENTVQVKIWKSLKLLNSVPFIKKKLVN